MLNRGHAYLLSFKSKCYLKRFQGSGLCWWSTLVWSYYIFKFRTKMKISHKKKAAPLRRRLVQIVCETTVYYLTHLQVRVPIIARREHYTDSGGNKSPSILFFWTVSRVPSWKSQNLSLEHLVRTWWCSQRNRTNESPASWCWKNSEGKDCVAIFFSRMPRSLLVFVEKLFMCPSQFVWCVLRSLYKVEGSKVSLLAYLYTRFLVCQWGLGTIQLTTCCLHV